MPTSTRFYAGQQDYIEQLNITVDEIGGGGGGAVTSVTATSPVVSSGGTTPVISIPVATTSTSGYLSNTDWNTFNGKAAIADITVTNLTGTVGFSKGGTGQTTQQAAMNALAAAVTTGSYLRGNGTNVVMSAIQVGDVPTLNQNTTGTAAIATTATTTNDVATASVVYPLWSSATSGNNGVKTSSTKLTFVPSTGTLTTTTFVGALTGNASTATSATNVTGTVAVANGGTGLTTLTSGSVLVGNGTSSPTLVAPSTSGNVLTSNGTTWVSSPATGGGSAITVKDEGSTLTSALTSLDFVGAGVSASNTGGAVTVTITGGGGSGGTVTSASVVSANGFAGSVANATTTPAITLSTTISGLLKGNGTAISAASSGTDYSAGTAALATGILKSTTSTGALTIATAGDFPTLNQNTTGTAANVTGTVAVANGGTGVTSSTGSGSNVLSNTPTLVTPVLGVASATTINKVAITAPATGSTLTIADGKTLTANNSLTFSGTDTSTLNIGTGGTLGTAAYTSSTSYAPTAGSASITTVGTISTGTWNGGVISGTYGGTGVNNGSSTLTLGGNHTNSGAFASTFTFTGTTGVTFPTSGNLISSVTAIPSVTGTPSSTTYLRGDGTWATVAGGGSGTVTTISVATANGFAGTVSNPTTTPVITLSTGVSGMMKGNGASIGAASAGVDYSAGTSALATGILKSTTSTGALTIAVAGDFPTLNQNTTGTSSNVTGVVLGANGGTGINNSGKTITLGGNLTTAGAFPSTFTMTASTGVTFPTTGTLATLLETETFSNKTLLSYKETVVALSGTTPSIGTSAGTIQTWTLTGNSTPTSALVDGESVTLMINDGVSAYTINWSTVAVTWLGGIAPTLATTGYTVIVLWKVSGVVYGSIIGAT